VIEGVTEDSTGCRLFQYENTLNPPGSFSSYAIEVSVFTGKLLSFEQDRLDAFSGVAQCLEKRLGSTFSFGMPCAFLPTALLWQYGHGRRRNRDISRNHHFPSWSWAGCTGAAWYFFCDEPFLILDRVDWLEHTELPLMRPQLWLQTLFSNSDTQSLKFYAWTAIFRLEHRQTISISWEYAYAGNTNPGPDCHYSTDIIDSQGCVAGGVDMRHLIELEGRRDGEYELVVLSRTVLPGQWTRTQRGSLDCMLNKPQFRDDIGDAGRTWRQWEECLVFHQSMSEFAESRFRKTGLFDIARYSEFKPWPLYNVMVIKHIDNGAERVAIGKVHIDAFWAARPVRRLVVLR
jgi:hypothetical protein